MSMQVSDAPFLWLGEHRAIDFLNTEPIVRGERVELLGSFERLVAWCTEAELLPRAAADEVLDRWAGSRAATRSLGMAHELRREVRRALDDRTASGRARLDTGLDALNACLRLAGPSTEVRVGPAGRFERRAHLGITSPEQVLRPVAESVVDLLCELDPALVRRCDDPACVLYFHDVSRNHARRWCSMAICGNRHKVAAHHERRRAERAKPSSPRRPRPR